MSTASEKKSTTPAPTKKDEDGSQSLIFKDTLTDTPAARGPLQPTVVDAQGVERYVGFAQDKNWSPAPVDPTPEAIAHHEKITAEHEAFRDERLSALGLAGDNVSEGQGVTKAALEAERA